MLTIEGTYKDGQIILADTPAAVDGSKVLVTFLQTKEINLPTRGINKTQAAELKGKLNSIADDWNQPEIDVYDVD